jgi:transcriptional regulator with XRE-family HTH domain
MDLSKRLKDFCSVRGTNRTALEKKLNLGNGTIGKWWKNGRVPNYANLLAVANELKTTVAYLSGETDDPEIKKALGDNVEGSASGEAEFMRLWRRLSPERQARELAFLREEVLKSEAEQDS